MKMETKALITASGYELGQVFLANNPWLRLRGLLGRPKLTPSQGMLISPCSSVHTIGMGYPLDIVYLDAQHTVLKVVSELKPWRSSFCHGAHHTLELVNGTAAKAQIHEGETLRWKSS
ncbi:DUF192 domain-containing protein [Shewanella algae]|uniref:DUF192 domain-containing protein n=1 Tax=Shewanella algae TaxID=38313 RepID=UPI001FBC0BBC|nr:DUF192 domain-containing protein [Shewanella algae]